MQTLTNQDFGVIFTVNALNATALAELVRYNFIEFREFPDNFNASLTVLSHLTVLHNCQALKIMMENNLMFELNELLKVIGSVNFN